MGTIQAGTGLMSGIDITGTVDKLMQIAGQSRDLLTSRTTTLQSQQTAVTQLTALLASMEFVSDNLGKDAVFQSRNLTSSNPNALTATATGAPANGTYQFTPIRVAQSQQWIGSGMQNATTALGGGSLTFRYGAGVDRGPALSTLNGGRGFVPGSLRITDRSGATAVIDLSTAQSVDDVLQAINNTQGINVTASIQGDHLQLTDHSGQATSHLKVQEVGSGTTAASLGLAGFDVAATTGSGQDIVKISAATELTQLNDGNGVETSPVLPDIGYTLKDGTTGTIDLSPIIPGSSTVKKELTLGDVLDEINAAQPGKLQAAIDPTGNHLVLTDLTSGSGTFQLTSLAGSNALRDLGLDGAAAGNTLAGRRILGGLNTVLLSSLNGGQGLGALGNMTLTDRSGASATVKLAGVDTLQGVVDKINAAGLGLSAAVNQAGNGIQVTDTTGATAHNLTISDADSSAAATKLGLHVDAAVSSRNSGDLHLKVVSYNTNLSDYNGGAGVALSTVGITDSAGKQATLDLSQSAISTIGDVIRAINRLGIGVQADLNSTGDGIALQDTAGGSGQLAVQEGKSRTAADLHLLGGTKTVTLGNQAVQEVDGSTTQTIQLAAGDSLQGLVNKINTAKTGLAASIFNDGSSKPNRLVLNSTQMGKAGSMLVDASGLGVALNQSVQAQDALLVVGGGSGSSGILATSSNNVFTGVLPGASIQITQASSQPISVTVSNSASTLTTNMQTLVDDYNKFRSQLQTDTAYDATSNTGSVLSSDPAALRLDTDLSQLLSGSFDNAGSIHALADLGLSFNNDGTLAFNSTKLQTAYSANPDAVKQFFTQKTTGFSDAIHGLLEQLAGAKNSLLSNRAQALADTITANQTRITQMNTQLDQQKQTLLNQFYAMEAAIGQMQDELKVINAMAIVDPYTGVSTTASSLSSGTTSSLGSIA